MNEADLDPLLALVVGIEQTRLGAGWKADAEGEAEPHEPTAAELLGALHALYWQGRHAYDAIAAGVDGAQPFAERIGEACPEQETPNDAPDAPF